MNLLTTCQSEGAKWEKLLKSVSNNSFEEQPKVMEMPWSGMGNLWADVTLISMKEISWEYRYG